MIMDSKLEFMDAVAVSGSAGTALKGDVIDLKATAVSPFSGRPMYWVIQVTTAFATGTTAEVAFVLASDATSSIATDGSATEHARTPAYDTGELTAGKVMIVPVPVVKDVERYLGNLVVTTTGTTTAGSVNSFLVHDAQDFRAYPDAIN